MPSTPPPPNVPELTPAEKIYIERRQIIDDCLLTIRDIKDFDNLSIMPDILKKELVTEVYKFIIRIRLVTGHDNDDAFSISDGKHMCDYAENILLQIFKLIAMPIMPSDLKETLVNEVSKFTKHIALVTQSYINKP